MDIYQRLTQDHETQRNLAAKIMQTSGASKQREKLFEEFKIEVENHAAAEEQSLYAALIEKEDGQEKAQHSIAEHKETSDLIEELEDMDMSSGAWIQKFEQLKDAVEHHVDEEEDEVFDLSRQLIDTVTANELAEKFDRRKERAAG